jgi:DNA gyrase/topoisomerase IV subunit B
MPAQLLFETTLDPSRRRLLRVNIPEDDRAYTERTVADLMGKEPESRFKFIMDEAYTAKDIDI